MVHKLTAAVVGLTVGAGHASNYAASPSVGRIILCDNDASRLESVGKKLGITAQYTDFEKMLSVEKPDVVSIAVPNNLHMAFSIRAMEAGAHVLCEKPMARNAAEAEEMLCAAKRLDKKLMINFNRRFQKEALAVKAAIDAGRLGEIYYARTIWQRRRGVPWWYPLERGMETCGGGALIDLGVHVLDRAMWLCGNPMPEWILANTFCKVSREEAQQRGIQNFALEDMAVAMMKMVDGSMLELEASWAANREDEAIITRLYGTRGGAVLHSTVNNGEIKDNRIFIEQNGVLEDFPIQTGDVPDTNVRQAFLDAIVHDTAVPCSPEEGVVMNRLLDAVYKSAESGMPVRFD